jgi:uncharacterized membrane protein YkvA (DUF1232 family)
MRVSFEISDKDIGHFRECMKKAREAVKDADESDIIEAARGMFEDVRGARTPAFIKDRLNRLESLTNMVQDEEWQMPDGPRDRVLRALVYFCDPEDLIPDSIPGIGYLDDAIMIELVLRELKHEIEAYEDFDKYRSTYNRRFKFGRDANTRAKRLAARREKLLERVERRQNRDRDEAARQPAPIW